VLLEEGLASVESKFLVAIHHPELEFVLERRHGKEKRTRYIGRVKSSKCLNRTNCCNGLLG
jgi:hypothetical protein